MADAGCFRKIEAANQAAFDRRASEPKSIALSNLSDCRNYIIGEFGTNVTYPDTLYPGKLFQALEITWAKKISAFGKRFRRTCNNTQACPQGRWIP
jgi:hypothetical protein